MKGASYSNSNRDLREPVELTTVAPVQIRNWLAYLGRADGLSVPQVIRQAIDNHIRHRKATDARFRDYIGRH